MKIQNKDINKFLSGGFQNFNAILLYGPDSGVVSERCKQIINKTACSKENKTPVNRVHLKYKEIATSPSVFADEVTSLGFFSNENIIIVENVEGSFVKTTEEILEYNKDNLIVFKAGELPASSAIRKFFETKTNMASLPCYNDTALSIKQIITKILSDNNLELENRASLDDIAETLHGDRKAIESEIKKLVLYYADNNNKKISDKDIYKIISADYLLLEYDALFSAIVNKDRIKNEQIINKMLSNGENIISILRHISSFFIKILKAKTIINKSKVSDDEALRSLAPPIFFKQIPIFKKALRKYTIQSILKTLEQLTESEVEHKTIAIPKEATSKMLTDFLLQN